METRSQEPITTTRSEESPGQVWIGLVHVGSRGDAGPITGIGAYVNVVAVAKNKRQFLKNVEHAVNEIDLDFLEIEDVELLQKRLVTHSVDPEIVNLAGVATVSGTVMFATFHNYPASDA